MVNYKKMGSKDDVDKAGTKKHRLDDEEQEERVEGGAGANLNQGSKKSRRDDEPKVDSSENESDDDSDSDEMSLGEDSDDDDDMEEGDIPENLIIDFEGVPPSEEDVGTVEGLLGQVYRGLPVNTLKLSQLVVLNDHISTLLKDQDPDDPSTYGVSSVVNVSQPATGINTEIALQFRELISQGIEGIPEDQGNKGTLDMLKKFADPSGGPPAQTIGLVVIEKLVNIPTPAIWQLLKTLKEDLGFENMHYTHFFLMAKMYRVGEEVCSIEEYYEPLQTLSSLQIDYPLPKDADTIPHNGQVGVPFRRLLVIGEQQFFQTVDANAMSV